jgi:hypothetical protein
MFWRRKNKTLVRVCVGCTLPNNAKLISNGFYDLIKNGKVIKEQYYDYLIDEDDLDYFLGVNSLILIKYKLLDIDEKNDEKIDTDQTTNWERKKY